MNKPALAPEHLTIAKPYNNPTARSFGKITVKVQDIDDPILTVKKSKTLMTLPLNC